MRRRILLFTLLALFLGSLTSMAANKFTLVIDAGHGGHDTGAPGAMSKEKNINLTVALAFGRYVEQNCPDVRVIYTRKTDVFVPLNERANIANRAKADLFISVHTNALAAGKIARGFETYTLGMHRAKDNLDVAMRENSVISMEKGYQQTYEGFDPKSSESYIMFQFIQGKNMEKSVNLAKAIQKSVCSMANRPDKGVHQAGFLVLRETSMPSCLIELGFITTPDEEQLLNDAQHVDEIARGIYMGFLQYKRRYADNITVPYKNTEEQIKDVPTVAPAVQPHPQVQQEKPKKLSRADDDDVPVFKVQILANDRKLSKGSSLLKGETDYDSYQEGGLWKYTMGASTNYNEINRLRRELAQKFPGAFVVAFKNGRKMDVNAAIREFVQNKKK